MMQEEKAWQLELVQETLQMSCSFECAAFPSIVAAEEQLVEAAIQTSQPMLRFQQSAKGPIEALPAQGARQAHDTRSD